MDEKYTLNLPPNNIEIELSKFSHKNWDFYSHVEYMMGSKIMDELTSTTDYIKIKQLPEVLNGYNMLDFSFNMCYNLLYQYL